MNAQLDQLVADVIETYRYSDDDLRERIELRTYDPHGPITTVAVHDRTLGIDLSPRLAYGFEGLAFVVRRVS